MEDYYDTGLIKYVSKNVTYGAKSEFENFNKSITRNREYYENGQLESRYKIVERPAGEAQRDDVTGEIIRKMPHRVRKYEKYNRSGELVEKGVDKYIKSKNIQYNVDHYKMIKTRKNNNWNAPKIKFKDKFTNPDTKEIRVRQVGQKQTN